MSWTLTALVTFAATASPYQTVSLPIVGGQPANENQFYSTVAIVDANTGVPNCTGTIVAPGVVVTAAHCLVEENEQTGEIIRFLQPNEVQVVVGALDPIEADDDQIYEADSLVVHPTYPNPGSDPSDPVGMGEQNDIAIIITSLDITQLEPTAILPMGQVDNRLTTGRSVVISGYGINDLDSGEGGILHIAETDFQRHNGKEFFASGATDSCSGDSGGPVYIIDSGVRYLVGASARGNETADVTCGAGGINTLVPAYIDWIAQEAGDLWLPPEDPTGVDGSDGSDGFDDADGSDGFDGADGSDGFDGADGSDGFDGADGSDGGDGSTVGGTSSSTDDGDDALCTTGSGRGSSAWWLPTLALIALFSRRRTTALPK